MNSPTHSQATAGSDCTATKNSHINVFDAVLADTGGKLTVLHAFSITAGGWVNPGRAPVRAEGANALIRFAGQLDVAQNGGNNSYGVLARAGGKIVVQGPTHVTLLPSGQYRRGVLSLGAGSEIELADVTVTSSGAATPRGPSAESGGKLTYRTANLNFQGYNGAFGIRQEDPNGDLIGGDTFIKVSGPASWAALVEGPMHINGKLDIESADGLGLYIRAAGQAHIGANSEIKGTSGVAVRIQGSDPTPLMAGNGLQITYPVASGTAFDAQNTAAASTTLAGATVKAETLWSASGSDYTFNAQGGAYTGKSTGNPLILKMSNAAVWNLNDDSDLKTLELTGNAALKLDTSHTLTAFDAAGVKNTSGIIDLKDATPATGDVLTIAGNYAGGGKLRLDVNLASGGGGAIGVDADALKVTGNVTGSTQIQVTALPGAGIATTGNGILIAEVTGTSPANAFTLAAPVISGGFQYTLHQVGNRWYLQSSPYTGANVASVPTLSHLGLLLTGGLLAGAAARARRKQKKA